MDEELTRIHETRVVRDRELEDWNRRLARLIKRARAEHTMEEIAEAFGVRRVAVYEFLKRWSD